MSQELKNTLAVVFAIVGFYGFVQLLSIILGVIHGTP